jgi:hypothetical protein
MSLRIPFRNGLAALTAIFLALPLASSVTVAQTKIAADGEKVKTGNAGKQILFRDNTSIKAGTDTALTVRRANYDAETGAGNIVIEVSKGAFRYITGDTTGSHTIKTPLATVGVRGTVIEGFVDGRGHELFALMEGAFDACTRVACQAVNTPGTFVAVSPSGAISPPTAIPTRMMSAMLLATPSVDLVLEYFFEIIDSGGDPLIRFRDLKEIQDGTSATSSQGSGGSSGGGGGGNPNEFKVCRGGPRQGQPHDCRILTPH